MFLKDRNSSDLVRIENVEALWDPFESTVVARHQAGEEEQAPESFEKGRLLFPSGEELPKCWLDPDFETR